MPIGLMMVCMQAETDNLDEMLTVFCGTVK